MERFASTAVKAIVMCALWGAVACGRIAYEVAPIEDDSADTDSSDDSVFDSGGTGDSDTQTDTDVSSGEDTTKDTGSGTRADTNNNTGVDTGSGSDTSVDTGSGSDTSVDTGTGSDTSVDTGTGSDTSVDTGTGSNTSVDTGTGVDTDAPPLPPSSISLVMTRISADISWTSGGGGTWGFLVVRSSSPIAWTPQAGRAYSIGETVSAGEVVYFGEETFVKDDDQGAQLSEGALYDFAVYAYNRSYEYSAPITDGALTMADDAHSRFRFYVRSVNAEDTFLITEELRLQIGGDWAENTVTGASAGSIGGYGISSVSSLDYFDTYAPWNLFDGDLGIWSTNYDTFANITPFDGTPDQWVEIDFGSNLVNVTGYQVRGGSDFPVPDVFDLRYWDEDISTFVLIPESAGTTPSYSSPYYTWADRGGDGTSAPNPPARVEVSNADSRITLTYSDGNGDTAGYMVVRGPSASHTFSPVDGAVYTTGSVGTEEVVYVGTSQSFQDTSVTNGSDYTYALYAFDALRNYSKPRNVTVNAHRGHRFYRFVVDSTATQTGSTLVFEVEFEAESVWLTNGMSGVDAGTIGGNSAVIDYSSHSVFQRAGWKAFDGTNSGSANNAWQPMNGTFSTSAPYDADPPQWVSVDFESHPINATGLRVWGDATAFTDGPDAFHLEVSDDGLSWKVVPGSSRSNVDTNSVYEYHF